MTDYHLGFFKLCYIFHLLCPETIALCCVFSCLDLRLKFLTALTFVVLVIRFVLRKMRYSLPLLIDCNLYSLTLSSSFFSFPVWWFSIWGLVPKPSKTILMPSCLRITKTISFSMKCNFVQDFTAMLDCMLLLLKYMNMYSLTFDLPAEFLSFYGLLNFYLYTLAFVYSPSKNALYGRWCNVL